MPARPRPASPGDAYFIPSEPETTVKTALKPVGRRRGFVVGRAAVVHDDVDLAGVGRQAQVDGGARASVLEGVGQGLLHDAEGGQLHAEVWDPCEGMQPDLVEVEGFFGGVFFPDIRCEPLHLQVWLLDRVVSVSGSDYLVGPQPLDFLRFGDLDRVRSQLPSAKFGPDAFHCAQQQ
ncbi:hypothetical protein JOF56_000813 [Kibdelosporangium banguiense]|uniref:Uncharacterized protein n=1 Tax=Kibdelosporangium banguiense TaxID=1365924 RepID=A0ABS4T7R5_9PSEU|nr:hypothetical protein [Kibdelosporangium banguiense]MBP2320428.1 hypothetical protein [Kibdelosporangium banguiense]